MSQAPAFVSMVFVYDTQSSGAELHLAKMEPARLLTMRERADRLYAMGEFAAAAELLLESYRN